MHYTPHPELLTFDTHQELGACLVKLLELLESQRVRHSAAYSAVQNQARRRAVTKLHVLREVLHTRIRHDFPAASPSALEIYYQTTVNNH